MEILKKMRACVMLCLSVIILTACSTFSPVSIGMEDGTVSETVVGTSGKENVVFRIGTASQWLLKQISEYNQQSEEFEVILDVCDLKDDISVFRERTSIELSTGKGADIYETYAFTNLDATPCIEKGCFADMTEYLNGKSEILSRLIELHRTEKGIYAVPVSFTIDTMYTNQKIPCDQKEWNYGAAFRLANASGAEYLCHKPFGWTDKDTGMAALSLFGGGNGQYEEFVNSATGECYFNSPEFVSLLEFINEHLDYTKQTEESDVLFHAGAIQNFLSLYAHDFTGEMKNGDYYGYPTKDGGTNYLLVRTFYVNEKSEHKDGVYDFFDFLLSKEQQEKMVKEVDGEFPVRADVLKDSWEIAKKEILIDSVPTDFNGNPLYEKRLFTDEEEALFWEILEHSKLYAYSTMLEDIVQEEVIQYFEGKITAQDAAKLIQNRVQLYLDEK